MRRRRTTSLKPTKAQHYKTKAKRNTALKAGRRANSSVADLQEQIERQARELDAARERETAAAEVLRVISSSPGDLKPVFEAIISNAQRICGARFGNLVLFDGKNMRVVAMHNAAPEHMAMRQRDPIVPLEQSILGPLVRTKMLVHVADITAEEPYASSALARVGGMRTALAVPMLRDDELVGAIGIYNNEVRPFTEKQIELLTNFASQAVIAIENTRLLSELRESLEQQTATSEVLSVISSSPGELEPVFQAMLGNATRICEAKVGNLFLREGNNFRAVAVHGESDYAEGFRRDPLALLSENPGSPLDRIAKTKQVIHIADLRDDQSYRDGNPRIVSLVETAGARTHIVIPMLKEGDLIGAIVIYRQEVRPFSDKQIKLLTNFAAQAVIAIENSRLLNELRQRTFDLTESLEQQTATSEVLGVISSSPGELEPVFRAMLANATRICHAKFGILMLRESNEFRSVAIEGAPEAYAAAMGQNPLIPPRPGSGLVTLAQTKQPVQLADLQAEPAYVGNRLTTLAGARTLLMVPLLKDDEVVGALNFYRQEVRPFTDKQTELVQNFAAQAVIAIENTRLLNELRELLDQQTATSEVLRVISSSPGELEPVFRAMLANATRICDAQFGNLLLFDGKNMRVVALHNAAPELVAMRQRDPIVQLEKSILGPLVRTKRLVHVADISAERSYASSVLAKVGGMRTALAVPMLRDDQLVGAIGIYNNEVRPFTEKQIELLTNFASQAVIAIENTRLLNELRQRTEDLSASLENLRTAQDRLVQTQKLASLGQLTAGIAHEIKNPLNFVNNFSSLSVELIDELQDALKDAPLDGAARVEIDELAVALRGNLDKIAQHGKRADSIVKNMLLHSREGSGERRSVDVNALVEESLNLAYHGARAEKPGFTITLERSFDPEAGEADVFPQEINRVLLNLIGNSFYAATKRQGEADGNGYEPILAASTRSLGDRVEIRIRDNGTGIPPEVKEKMFNPFFTTKPAGEGTGLGLSISHDIIVKQHSGSIEVETEPGEFTEFRIILPRTAG